MCKNKTKQSLVNNKNKYKAMKKGEPKSTEMPKIKRQNVDNFLNRFSKKMVSFNGKNKHVSDCKRCKSQLATGVD